MKLDAFTRAFLECALWSSNDGSRDDGGDPLDMNYTIDDIDPTCLTGLMAECEAFQEANADALDACSMRVDLAGAGHDFWLTRNRHGAGFWDGDWFEPHATTLTESSHKFGEVILYVGDNGMIYASGYEETAHVEG